MFSYIYLERAARGYRRPQPSFSAQHHLSEHVDLIRTFMSRSEEHEPHVSACLCVVSGRSWGALGACWAFLGASVGGPRGSGGLLGR